MNYNDHIHFLKIINEHLGNWIISNDSSLKLKDLWDSDKRIYISYNSQDLKNHDIKFNNIKSYWGNTTSVNKLYKFLNDKSKINHNDLYILQIVLTPTKWTIINGLFFGPRSLKNFVNKTNKKIPKWLDEWKNRNLNIIIVDFESRTKLVDIIIKLNQR
jgi:hypothetical protein